MMGRWCVALAMAWWLMSGWGYGGRILSGPFGDFGACNHAGLSLPWEAAADGWHCEVT